MEKINLGDEQLQAITNIQEFISDKFATVFSLVGAAGTGKTTIIKNILTYLEDDDTITYCLCAPTHKAALVLERATDRKAQTLHKLLSLSPRLDLLKLDFKMLEFNVPKDSLEIPYNGIVICDEASMINDDLFKLLCEKCKDRQTKILFVSDEKQLMPVNGLTVSKVYSVENIFRLTKIYRQSSESALIPILSTLRDSCIDHFEQDEKEHGSIFTYDKVKDFLIKSVEDFNTAIDNKNILGTKILAYTNSRVAGYNKTIRKLLWKNQDEYHVGEFLTAYENGETDDKMQYWNSMDYIVVSLQSTTKDLPFCNITVNGYILTLYDSLNNCNFTIFIISRKTSQYYLDIIGTTLESLRLSAIKNKNLWRNYYALAKSFTTPVDLIVQGRIIKKKSFDYGYACTVHKSQGSSIDNIYIDMWDINKDMNLLERRQLQYVAVSRAKNNAYILQL